MTSSICAIENNWMMECIGLKGKELGHVLVPEYREKEGKK